MSQEICSEKFKVRAPAPRRPDRRLSVILVLALLGSPYASAYAKEKDKSKPKQEQPRADRDKPVLIREPDQPEGPPEVKPRTPDPLQAEQSLDVGHYYFKRKRYDAAIGRYKEAIEYKPDYWEAHKWLAKAYEKKNEPAKAIDLYEAYLAKFPSSGFAEEIRKEIQRLRKKDAG